MKANQRTSWKVSRTALTLGKSGPGHLVSQVGAALVIGLVFLSATSVRAEELPIQKGDHVTVTTDRAEVKSEDQVVASVTKGQQFQVMGVSEDWVAIEVGDKSGWVQRDCVARVPAARKAPKALPPEIPVIGRETVTTSLGQVLRYCSPGSFTMGSPSSEKGRNQDEVEVSVSISKGFYLGEHGVTQAEFKKLMGTTPWAGKPNVKEGDDYPATYVDYAEAREFCIRLTEQDAHRLPPGYMYCLPSEAQREYACRAGTNTAYSFDDDPEKLGDYAWFKNNTKDAGESYAHRVAQKKPNPWGFYDLHGNVWEWCRDVFAVERSGGADPLMAHGQDALVVRGGSWFDPSEICRSAKRLGFRPTARHELLGFRIALVPVKMQADAPSASSNPESTPHSPSPIH